MIADFIKQKRAFGFNLILFLLLPSLVFAFTNSPFKPEVSGYVKTLNFFTGTTGLTPEFAANPLDVREKHENVFASLERFRLKVSDSYDIDQDQKVGFKLEYDHQAYFGSFVSTGDFRIARNISENSQFADLSQTLVEEESAYYEHRLYRAVLTYKNQYFDLDIGRQQIPWGVAHFYTPTDLFNPFNPTQIELDERDGVDAASIIFNDLYGYKTQFVYTPPGKDLHPQRFLARVSRDFNNYEVGVLGGRVGRDHAAGFDASGNIRDAVVRGEFLYREVDKDRDFIRFTANVDYNFPHNIHSLLEYHFNGEGRRDRDRYRLDRAVKGEIQQLAKNYLGHLLGYDITPLLRFENRTLFNMDDVSFFIRPELRYEFETNWLLTIGAQFYLGDKNDEYGLPENLYLGELKYSF
jgi:hypothetical protein